MIEWAKNRYVQIVVAFILGGFLGYTFYPTKTVEERSYEKAKEEFRSTIEENKQTFLEEKTKLLQQVQEEQKTSKQYKEEVNKKLTSLTTENRRLKQKVRKKKFKLVKPDGTIVEKEFEETDTDETSSVVTSIKEEFTRKVSAIETRWKKIHTKRVKELKAKFREELKKKKTETVIKEKVVTKEKIVKVNDKKLRPELGFNSDKKIYTHLSYPLWGPFILGGGFDFDKDSFGPARLGVGIEF